MELTTFVLNFASSISMLLVIYAAYMMIHRSRGEFANAFKIILVGHIPSAAVHFLNSLSYFGINVLPDEGSQVYNALNLGVQVISALSVFIAIYEVKKALFDKIEKFTRRFRRNGNNG